MQILVIAATELEIELFKAQNTAADILITGVGVPATMYHVQKSILQKPYDMLIQAGIAGSFNTTIELGQTVLIKQDCFADLGMEEKGNYSPVFEKGLANANAFPYTGGWLVNPAEHFTYANLPALKAITVNKISDSALQKQQYINAFNADLESMEGAALHYVCLQEKIPFLQIRSASNYVGERDKTKWKIKEAINNLNDELIKLISTLTQSK